MRIPSSLALGVFLVGCGSSEAGKPPSGSDLKAESCDEIFADEFVPCGGDVSGLWKEVACSELVSPLESSAGACEGTVSGTSFQTSLVEGFMNFRPEGDYITSGAAQIWFVETMPIECRACDLTEREHRDDDGSRAIVGYSRCEIQGSDCVCKGSELASEEWSIANGRYHTDGTTIETAPGNFFAYCRDGDRLTLDQPWSAIDSHDGVEVRTRIELIRLQDPSTPR